MIIEKKRTPRSGSILRYVYDIESCRGVDKEISSQRCYRNTAGSEIGFYPLSYADYLDAGKRDTFNRLKQILKVDESMVVDFTRDGAVDLPDRCFEDTLEIYAMEKTWIKTMYGVVKCHVDTDNQNEEDGSHLAYLTTEDSDYPWLRVRVWNIDDKWVSQIFYNCRSILQYVDSADNDEVTFAYRSAVTGKMAACVVGNPTLISVDENGFVVDHCDKLAPLPTREGFLEFGTLNAEWICSSIMATNRVFVLTSNQPTPKFAKVKLHAITRYTTPEKEKKQEEELKSNFYALGFAVVMVVLFVTLFMLTGDYFLNKLP